MSKSKHTDGDGGDAVFQVRATAWVHQKLGEVADHFGMKQRDCVGRLIKWFIMQEHDVQTAIMHRTGSAGGVAMLSVLLAQEEEKALAEGVRQEDLDALKDAVRRALKKPPRKGRGSRAS